MGKCKAEWPDLHAVDVLLKVSVDVVLKLSMDVLLRVSVDVEVVSTSNTRSTDRPKALGFK
jgi:hypothetical protein